MRLRNIRPEKGFDLSKRLRKFEVFRTPDYSYKPLLDYRPDWFEGSGYDPSAGDGRMIREIIRRGNRGPHYLNDIREEELPTMQHVGIATVGNYLDYTRLPVVDFWLTNPPFTLTTQFVDKAKSHVNGPICVLQSLAFQGTKKRSQWLKLSGLRYVLNLARRPKWEVDTGKGYSNIWDFAWFVFFHDYNGQPQMDWIS